MALVTIQRSPSASNSPPSSEYGSSIHSLEDEPNHSRSLSEYYFAVKGFAVLLPKKECQQGRHRKWSIPPADIQNHLQAILHLLRPGDTLQMAVRLESQHAGRTRYLAVVTTYGRQDTEESCLLGVDFAPAGPTIGLVLAVLADTMINLDGDGGFSVSSAGRKHIFKPVSVQAMWSALQSVHKESAKAREHHCYHGGLTHDWVTYYDKSVTSDQSCVNEWNAMEGLESKRPPSPDSLSNKEETELLIRSKLKEIMMSVDIDEVTSKYIRQRLEEDLKMDLFQFKSFIDQEMLTILGQMDAATEIFPHVYLGSEWNASNLEELKKNGVGFILNVTKEIDNFYPGMFDYLNIRVYDDENTELLRHWDDTYKYISQVKERGSKVLVHCKMGISRSASVVIAYAMKALNLSLDNATELVKKKRSCIKPNQAFTSQLKIYQGILDASRQRHNVLFRSKSDTNLKTSAASGTTSSNTRFSYAPRGMQVMPIPDFKPRPNPLTGSISATVVGTALLKDPVVPPPDRQQQMVILRNPPTGVSLRVPSPVEGRRPRSWSPDDDTVKLLNLPPYDGGEFGEGLTKSRSLNEQAWQAHVTLVQHGIRDPGGGGEGIVEAVNPLYVTPTLIVPPEGSPPSGDTTSLQEVSASSVKERICEFEGGKIIAAGKTSPSTALPPGGVPSQALNRKTVVMTIDNVTTTASSTDPSSGDVATDEGAEEVVAASLLISATTPCEEEGHRGANEVMTWPSGIVRKQKEGLEDVFSRQGSSHSLSSVEGVRGDSCKRDDAFSVRVDRVLERDEITGTLGPPDTPKEGPSRQSSWGSFDTSLGGVSRNSSFGTLDISKASCQGSMAADKEHLPVIRRSKSVKVVSSAVAPSGTLFQEGSSSSDDLARGNGLGLRSWVGDDPAPVEDLFRRDSGGDVYCYRVSGLKTSPQTPEHEIPLPGTVKQQMQKLESKCLMELQPKGAALPTKGNFSAKENPNGENLSVPLIGRSFSSGCVCSPSAGVLLEEDRCQITRSCSEKRAKTDLEGSKGNVKKITKALETQTKGLKGSLSLKRVRPGPAPIMPRSQSLERLGGPGGGASPPTPNKRLSACSLRREMVSSQNFLDELVTQTQQQAHQLAQEEINVRNLVGLFEDGKPQEKKSKQENPLQDKNIQDDRSSFSTGSLVRCKVRPRSESMGEKDLPPVPQRKSSLDYTFKPPAPPVMAPQSPPRHLQKTFTNSSPPLSNGIGAKTPPSPNKLPPSHNSETAASNKAESPPKLPTPPGGRACGSEVRRRKQQGKTHPLSKLTQRENPL